jgi:hypothetical protein
LPCVHKSGPGGKKALKRAAFANLRIFFRPEYHRPKGERERQVILKKRRKSKMSKRQPTIEISGDLIALDEIAEILPDGIKLLSGEIIPLPSYRINEINELVRKTDN